MIYLIFFITIYYIQLNLEINQLLYFKLNYIFYWLSIGGNLNEINIMEC